MTVESQQHMIFGALCMDEGFRTAVFAPPEPESPGASESYEQKISRLLTEYASTNEAQLDKSVVTNVLNVLRGPCRQAALDAFAQAKIAACPCWPC